MKSDGKRKSEPAHFAAKMRCGFCSRGPQTSELPGSPLSRSLWRFRCDERGAAIVEYAMIMAIITVGIFIFFAPNPNAGALNFYDTLRDAYRRAVVFVSVPLL